MLKMIELINELTDWLITIPIISFQYQHVTGNTLTNQSGLIWYTTRISDDGITLDIKDRCFDLSGECVRWAQEGYVTTCWTWIHVILVIYIFYFRCFFVLFICFIFLFCSVFIFIYFLLLFFHFFNLFFSNTKIQVLRREELRHLPLRPRKP